MRGLISDDDICVRDDMNQATYVTNISTEHTEKVIIGDGNVYITSCAPIIDSNAGSNVIVCGKENVKSMGDSLNGCITIYDRQWKVIRDINIPRNTDYVAMVYVNVDRYGMIFTAQWGQSNIYVINPADGKIVQTITMHGKMVRGDVQALYGNNIARTIKSMVIMYHTQSNLW